MIRSGGSATAVSSAPSLSAAISTRYPFSVRPFFRKSAIFFSSSTTSIFAMLGGFSPVCPCRERGTAIP